MSDAPIFIDGTLVTLRPLCRENLQSIFTYMNNQAVTKYLYAYLPLMLEDEERWYEKQIGNSGNVALGIYTKDAEAKFIGTMGIHRIDHRCQRASTGAAIGDTSCLGKGYGTDAKMHLLHWAFNTLNLRKVTSSVLATNPRSKKYLEKTGYRQVGVLREHHFVNGEFVDEYLMEVFRDEFFAVWERYTADSLST